MSSGAVGGTQTAHPDALHPHLATIGPVDPTPMRRKAARVAKASAPSRNPLMRVSPSAIAASMIERCEIDLSPGTRRRPRKVPPGATR
jgi:hypothetical protein